MIYCFDIDDTISRHKDRDYANATPIEEVISRMLEIRLTDENARIILHTARGMNSCHGDVLLAEQKNRATLERWLKEHDVPYNEIVFGKPLADVYIDDKALRPLALATMGITPMKGFSGNNVYRVGDIVIKECNNAQEQADWYAKDKERESISERHYVTPDIYSVTMGRLYMQYINAPNVYRVMRLSDHLQVSNLLYKLINITIFESKRLEGENDISRYSNAVMQKASAIGYDATQLCKHLQQCTILRHKTYCHGDFTLSNILFTKPYLTLIDPSSTYGLNTWLADAAKLRACLTGLNDIIEGVAEEGDFAPYVPMFDSRFTEQELEAITLLEKTHYIRVAYSAYTQGKHKEVEHLKKHLL